MNRSFLSIFLPLMGFGVQAGASESGAEVSQNTSGLQSYYNDPCIETPKFCPAYNGPAGLDLCNGWDVYANASFLYYLPVQDNMPLATTIPIRTQLQPRVRLALDRRSLGREGAGSLASKWALAPTSTMTIGARWQSIPGSTIRTGRVFPLRILRRAGYRSLLRRMPATIIPQG